MMNLKYIEDRKKKLISSLQQESDIVRKMDLEEFSNPNVIKVPIHFIEGTLQGFIDFITKDKKRFLDLEKAKYDYIHSSIKESRKRIRKRILRNTKLPSLESGKVVLFIETGHDILRFENRNTFLFKIKNFDADTLIEIEQNMPGLYHRGGDVITLLKIAKFEFTTLSSNLTLKEFMVSGLNKFVEHTFIYGGENNIKYKEENEKS